MAVWTTEVRHEDDGFGTMVAGIFNGRKGAHNALVVCDVLVGVERDVEIDLGGNY